MRIQFLFIRHIIKKNLKLYLWMITTTVMILFVVKVSVGMIKELMESQFPNLYEQRYLTFKMNAIQCVFILLGMVLILLNYYRAIRKNYSSCQMFKTLGATKQQIRLLVMVQNSSILLFTVPCIIGIELLIYEKLMPVIVKGQIWNIIKIKSIDISSYVLLLLIIFVAIHSLTMLKKMSMNGYRK